MKITRIWFEGEHICAIDTEGQEYRQSLLWYPRLKAASTEDRENYTTGFISKLGETYVKEMADVLQ